MPGESADPPPVSPKRFADLNLSKVMRDSLNEAGYETPTEIQSQLIPIALTGADVIGQARTGTGKTASFVIPILERIVPKPSPGPQALMLVPTRELAVQVKDEFTKLAHGRKFRCVAIYGGTPIRGQMEKLKRGVEAIVGTPGRVLDHLARGSLTLDSLQMVVLDEADRMLDIGFRPDIERILKRCPRERQTLLLSATVPPPIARLAERYMRTPTTLNCSPKELSVETIEQYYFTVDAKRKFDLLLHLLAREKPRQAIIFCRTKRGAEKVYQRLAKKAPKCDQIHGDLSQSQRNRVMQGFREGKVRFLTATDVIGRGIDVSTVSHIVNYDIPKFCDDYVHRVGRTGRMGREGVAYTFVTPEEGSELTRIEERINRLLIRDEMRNFVAVAGQVSGAPFMRGEPSENDGPGPQVKTPEGSPPPAPNPRAKRYRKAL